MTGKLTFRKYPLPWHGSYLRGHTEITSPKILSFFTYTPPNPPPNLGTSHMFVHYSCCLHLVISRISILTFLEKIIKIQFF